MIRDDGSGEGAVESAAPGGLCGACLHGRKIESGKGSVFLLCRRSEGDPRYPRYPRLPVLRCAGYEAAGTP